MSRGLSLVALAWVIGASPAVASGTEAVSVGLSVSTEPEGWNLLPSISADGRYVAFQSYASNLVAGDTNSEPDIFVHDRTTGATTRVSVDSEGTESNAGSSEPSISADGRYVAFRSYADNLVAGDTNGADDIFVHDRTTGETTRLSVDSAGTEGNDNCWEPSISADGRYVAFTSPASNLVTGDTNGMEDIFVHDRTTGATTRVSVDSAGTESNSYSSGPSISADGRYVAFSSSASNLVAGDTNGAEDIFVRDRKTGATTRVSVDSAGTEGNSYSFEPSISADGRYLAFTSGASNLVAGDSNENADIFVHDRTTGETTRVSVDSAGTESNTDSYEPSISADGRYVAFTSSASNLVAGDTNGTWDTFVHDRMTEETTRMSVDSAGTQGNSQSREPSISADGRYVAFYSLASNLVAGDTNWDSDIFVHDRASGTTARTPDTAIAPPAGAALLGNGPSFLGDQSAISSSGRQIAFYSSADNLVADDTNFVSDVFVRDRTTGATARVSVNSAGTEGNSDSAEPSMSADGRYVAFTSYASNLVTGDTNGRSDVFVHDRATGAMTRVSVDSAGTQGDFSSYEPSISGDGRYVAFYSFASNLVGGDTNWVYDIFVRDRTTGATTRVSVNSAGSEANSSSRSPSISADGRYVAFSSYASNLVAGDTNGMDDIFVHDRTTGATTRVSVDSAGTESNYFSREASISGDGRYVAFTSYASNLVAGDTNGDADIFVHDRTTGATTRVSVDSAGTQGNRGSWEPSISADGRHVAFYSGATNLVAGDTNGAYHIFVHDRTTGETTRVSINSAGTEGNGFSRGPSISADGLSVAFESDATNLAALDSNAMSDVFVRDLPLFADGFESGDLAAWSASVP